MSRDSGAGAYVQSVGTGARSPRLESSVIREVVAGLVDAGLLLAELHQDVVHERRGAKTVEVRRQPVRTERLVNLDEILDRVLRCPDPARRLHADATSGLVEDVSDRLEHHELHG